MDAASFFDRVSAVGDARLSHADATFFQIVIAILVICIVILLVVIFKLMRSSGIKITRSRKDSFASATEFHTPKSGFFNFSAKSTVESSAYFDSNNNGTPTGSNGTSINKGTKGSSNLIGSMARGDLWQSLSDNNYTNRECIPLMPVIGHGLSCIPFQMSSMQRKLTDIFFQRIKSDDYLLQSWMLYLNSTHNINIIRLWDEYHLFLKKRDKSNSNINRRDSSIKLSKDAKVSRYLHFNKSLCHQLDHTTVLFWTSLYNEMLDKYLAATRNQTKRSSFSRNRNNSSSINNSSNNNNNNNNNDAGGGDEDEDGALEATLRILHQKKIFDPTNGNRLYMVKLKTVMTSENNPLLVECYTHTQSFLHLPKIKLPSFHNVSPYPDIPQDVFENSSNNNNNSDKNNENISSPSFSNSRNSRSSISGRSGRKTSDQCGTPTGQSLFKRIRSKKNLGKNSDRKKDSPTNSNQRKEGSPLRKDNYFSLENTRKHVEHVKAKVKQVSSHLVLSSIVLIKMGDDLRKDLAVMNTFRFINYIWRRNNLQVRDSTHNNINEHFVERLIYGVIPITNQFGCIEFIYGCSKLDAIYDVISVKHSLNIKYKLIASGVASFIASFVIGARDRHNDNILIRSDGTIFDIDFGFILGETLTGLDASRLAVSDKFVKFLGENGWKKFISVACEAYLILREYYVELSQFVNITFDFLNKSKENEEYLKNALKIEYTRQEAERYIREKLKNSPSRWKTRLKNKVHGIAQGMKKL